MYFSTFAAAEKTPAAVVGCSRGGAIGIADRHLAGGNYFGDYAGERGHGERRWKVRVGQKLWSVSHARFSSPASVLNRHPIGLSTPAPQSVDLTLPTQTGRWSIAPAVNRYLTGLPPCDIRSDALSGRQITWTRPRLRTIA